MNRLITIFLLLTIGIASAASKLPLEVKNYIETREACEHFRGEPWENNDEYKSRKEFIFAKVKEYCTGTDKQLAKLRHKYRKAEFVMDSLQKYRTKIDQ
jgi:hypothetical protein